MAIAQVATSGTSRKALLTRLIFAVTIVPLLCYAAVAPFFASSSMYQSILWGIGVVGVTHVGMTAYFYLVDQRYAEIIAKAKIRYYVLPAICIVSALAAFLMLDNQQLFWYFIAHYTWLLWHFNRQNFGLYAMFLRSEGQTPLSPVERNLFNCLCIGAVPVALTLYPDTSKNLEPWASTLVLIGRGLFIACAVGLVIEAVRWERFRSRVSASWLGLSVAFFIPTVMAANPAIALAFYAHPMQYIIMMLFVAGATSGRRLPWNSLARIVALALIGVSLYALIATFQNGYLGAEQGGRIALALAYGVTQWHLLADAGLWKMRDAAPRQNFEESFAFMFQKLK